MVNREVLYGSILKNLPMAVILLNENKEIVEINDEAEELLEYIYGASEKTYSNKLMNFCGNEILKFASEGRQEQSLEKNISNIYVEVKLKKIIFEPGSSEYIIIIMNDVSLIRRTENTICKTENNIRTILENMPVMLDALDEDGNVVVWNKECERVTGYSDKEMILCSNALDRLHSNKGYREHIKGKRHGKDYRNMEVNITCKDGSERVISWNSISGMVPIPGFSFWAVGVDMTEYRKMEEELIQKKSELEAIFMALPDLYFRIGSDGTYLDCYAGNKADLYIPKEEFMGKKVHEVFKGEVGISCLKKVQKVIKTKRMNITEYSLDMKKGLQYYEARILPLLDDQAIVIVRNITERKNMEWEMVKSEKLKTTSILAGGIAHDFNNILTIILGNLSLAKFYINNKDKCLEKLAQIENGAFQAQKLTRQFIAFTKDAEPNKSIISLGSFLRENVNLAISGSKAVCKFHIDDCLWPVEVDESQINQVINNFIINAVQAMPGGGEIELKAKNVEVDEQNERAFKPGKYVKIKIKDTGVGITKENMTRIFDPYFTTKKDGSGLGLPISYSIIKKHNGYISVDSEVNKGTTFYIYIPAKIEDVENTEDENVI